MRFCAGQDDRATGDCVLHRGREQLVRQRTMLVNALRAHLAEFGMVAAQGLRNVGELIAIVRDDGDTRLPDVARQVLQVLAAQLEQIEAGDCSAGEAADGLAQDERGQSAAGEHSGIGRSSPRRLPRR